MYISFVGVGVKVALLTEKLSELKHELSECEDFLSNFEAKLKQEVAIARRDYQEACENLSATEKESERKFQKLLKSATLKGYSQHQFANLKQVNIIDPVETASEECDATLAHLEKFEEMLTKHPKYRQSAIDDRAKIIKQIQDIEKQLGIRSNSYPNATSNSKSSEEHDIWYKTGEALAVVIIVSALLFLLKSCIG